MEGGRRLEVEPDGETVVKTGMRLAVAACCGICRASGRRRTRSEARNEWIMWGQERQESRQEFGQECEPKCAQELH